MSPIGSSSVDKSVIDGPDPAWVRSVMQAVRGLRYGSVELVIHDGRIVQIERREKVRIEETTDRGPDHRERK